MKNSTLPANMKRRAFLGTSLATLGVSLGAGLLPQARASHQNNTEIWLSAQGKDSDHFALSWVHNPPQSCTSVASGFRGHGVAQHPQQKNVAVMFSRSPGTRGMVVDLSRGEITHRFSSAASHHMHGHGCFSADGRILYTTESDFSTGAGKIVMRETRHYQAIGEWSSYGTGPHDIQLMPDQRTLVIANGGLRTRPESGAQVLNLDTMKSTLTYIDSVSGELIRHYQVDEAKASIRHLDVAADGTVALATQVQRPGMPNQQAVTLAAVHHPGSDKLMMLEAPQTLTERFNDYMGSVAINEQERLAAFSSPRGNLVGFWNIDNGQLAGYHAFHDVCGLGVSQDQQYFILSNSAGEIRRISALSLKEHRQLRQQFQGMHWDNHLFSVALS